MENSVLRLSMISQENWSFSPSSMPFRFLSWRCTSCFYLKCSNLVTMGGGRLFVRFFAPMQWTRSNVMSLAVFGDIWRWTDMKSLNSCLGLSLSVCSGMPEKNRSSLILRDCRLSMVSFLSLFSLTMVANCFVIELRVFWICYLWPEWRFVPGWIQDCCGVVEILCRIFQQVTFWPRALSIYGHGAPPNKKKKHIHTKPSEFPLKPLLFILKLALNIHINTKMNNM